MSKRIDRAIGVKKVVLQKVLGSLAEGPMVVGADIAKKGDRDAGAGQHASS